MLGENRQYSPTKLLKYWILAAIEYSMLNTNTTDDTSIQLFVKELIKTLGLQG